MGLYDRDYMRERPTEPDEDESGLSRMVLRRKWLVVGGLILIVAGIVTLLVLK